MSGTIVDPIEEIRNRLATAQASGTLTNFKDVRVGKVEWARKANDFPIINVEPINAVRNPLEANQRYGWECTVEVRLLFSKLSVSGNSMYQTSNTSGPLYELENVLNAIDNDTSGSADVGLNNTINQLPTYQCTFDYQDDLIEVVIEVTYETATFTAGDL